LIYIEYYKVSACSNSDMLEAQEWNDYLKKLGIDMKISINPKGEYIHIFAAWSKMKYLYFQDFKVFHG
jgi:hypothetical protein